MRIITIVLSVLMVGRALASGSAVPAVGEPDFGSNWVASAPRPEIQPRCFSDPSRHLSGLAGLAISGDGNPLEYGGWSRMVTGIHAGRFGFVA